MKLLRRLTIKNLLMNKSRTIVTIIGIMLSVALITTVAGIVSSLDLSNYNSSLVSDGDYEVFFYGDFGTEEMRTIRANRKVKDIYSLESIGQYRFEDPKYTHTKYFMIYGTNYATLDASICKLDSGRYPEKDDELLLSPDINRYSAKQYQVGDKIEVENGKRMLKEGAPNEKMLVELFGGREIPVNAYGDFGEYEEWVVTDRKTYTVVGILKSQNGFLSSDAYANAPYSSIIRAYTFKEPEKSEILFVDLKEEYEKDYLEFIAELLGVGEGNIDRYLTNYGMYNGTSDEELTAALENNPLHIMYFGINNGLLSAKGILTQNNGGFSLSSFQVMLIGMVIVMFASVFIIRNSFAISITEKTRLYGMLSSVGATPRQIRQNVFFEAFLLGLIGIPLGVLLGTGIAAGLVFFSNTLLKEQLGSYDLVFGMNWSSILLAVVIGIVTIIFSALASAMSASRTSPMEAIRSNKDVNISKKQLKNGYKTPKWISKVFGIGGSIAWKNMKRSRKQYRTTVISIIVSVFLFLAINSSVEYVMNVMKNEDYYIIANSEYNITVQVSADEKCGNEYYDSYLFPKNGQMQYIENLASEIGLTKFRINYTSDDFKFEVKDEWLCDEVKPGGKYYSRITQDVIADNKVNYRIMAVDKDSFKELCNKSGLDYEQCKDKGFIWNYNIIDRGEDGYTLRESEKTKLFKDPVGLVLKGECVSVRYVEKDPETIEASAENSNNEDEYYEDGYDYDSLYEEVTETHKAEIEIAAAIEDIPATSFASDNYSKKLIIVTDETFSKAYGETGYAYIDAGVSDPDAFEDRMKEEQENGNNSIYSVVNYSHLASIAKSMRLIIQIFVYSFILVITLIGITNLFNTVTTNMKLRQKEFAMLRSIGTTSRELHRMILLESALYTAKSLLIGVPLGVLSGWGLAWAIGNTMGGYGYKDVYYMVPWMPILICLLFVLLLLFAIMRFSIAKFNKQNIIETIRNDNI